MRLTRPVVALSVGAMVALAACSGSGSTTPTQSSAPHGTLVPTFGGGKDPTRQPPAAPIPGARRGGTLTVLSAEGPYTMDPTEAYFTNEASILSGLVTRSLTQYVYDPEIREMVLVPDLATDLGRPSPDFTTWKFTLRPGVRFENGRPVTAEDLEYGIERSLDRKTFPLGADYSNIYFLHGDTFRGPYTTPGPYDGVTVDGTTITIRMATPFPDMSYWAAFPAMSPIPAGEASDPATYKNHPWATGPYMFKDYTPGKALTLVRNPYWDPDTDPGRHQFLDGFAFDFDMDRARIDQIMLADSGRGQTTLSNYNVLADDYRAFNASAPDRLVLGTNLCTYAWYPDNRKISDREVRRALAYAYPYRAAWAAAGEIPGVTRRPGTNIMPPEIPGRVAYNPLAGHAPGETDAAKAKALLTAAGKLNYPIRFPYETDDETSVAVKNVIMRALATAGFDPQPVGAADADHLDEIIQNPQTPVDVRGRSWCADWPSGSSWIPPIFTSRDIDSVGFGSNFAAFSSKDVDNRINEIPHLLLTEQPPAWNALDKRIQTQYFPVVVTAYGGMAMMRGSRVHNDIGDPLFRNPTWKDIWLG